MDRLNHLRGEAGGSRDSTLDTSSPPSEAFMTANESSKYFSLSEESEFDISAIKDVSLATADPERTITDDQLISNLSPIGKKADLDSYKIGKQIEAANILSGGVDIFDDNDNSNDGNELIIDDNAEEDKSNELILVDTAEFKGDEETLENVETETPSKDTEVVLQIDGKNVDAIDIGNGLYLYRKEGEEELAAVQIIDDDQQQPSFKFLKVRENAEGNLEVYEEIQIEVPKEVPAKEGKSVNKNISHVPIKDISKMKSEPTSNIVANKKVKIPQKEVSTSPSKESESESNKDIPVDTKEVNFNGKMKISESRKSPVIGSFTPMTYHSTPNKEGKPLTKTMVDLQLHPSRHSDNVKKTIEVHTDNSKQKSTEIPSKTVKDVMENKSPESKLEVKEPLEQKNIGAPKPKESEILIEKKLDVEVKKETHTDTGVRNPLDTEKNEDSVPIDLLKETNVTEKEDLNKTDDSKKVSNKEVKSTVENLPSQSNVETKSANVLLDKASNIISIKASESSAIKNEIINIVSSSTEGKEGQSSLHKDLNKNDVKDEKESISASGKQQNKADEVSSSQEVQIPEKAKSVSAEPGASMDNRRKSENIEIATDKSVNQSNIEKNVIAEDPKETEKKESSTKPENSIPKDTSFSKTTVAAQANPEKSIELPNVKAKEENTSKKVDSSINFTKPELGPEPEQTKTEILVKKTKEPKNIAATEIKPNLQSNYSSHKNKDIKSVVTNKAATSTTDVDKKEIPKLTQTIPSKPINNSHAAVPFGKWTEANRQEFLNKIKESKVPTNHSNGKQIKNSNDLNRRDVLKKIDSQRSNIASAKAQEMANTAKLGQGVKKEAPIFINKVSVTQDKVPVKSELEMKTKPAIIAKKPTKQETHPNPAPELPTGAVTNVKKESRAEINNQDLIDKTIDDIIGRALPLPVKDQEDTSQNVVKDSIVKPKPIEKPIPVEKPKILERKPNENPSIYRPKPIDNPKPPEKLKQGEIPKPMDRSNLIEKPKPIIKHSVTKKGPNSLLDDIEMEMNKLHGIPFVERPQHELPQVSHRQPFKTYGKAESDKASNRQTKVPKLLPFVNKGQQKIIKESAIELDSEEEIIEHEPITGDIDMNKKDKAAKFTSAPISMSSTASNVDVLKKESIITENEFDKFARRNSKTYENCFKVNFDGNESHNVVQTVVEKDNIKLVSKLETEPVNKEIKKHEPINAKQTKLPNTMFSDNDHNKNYPSKVKMAYQSVMTAKRQLERPITIIEDKPVKVMYVDSNTDYYPNTLNVKGKELPLPKKFLPKTDANVVSSCDSLDSDMGAPDDSKSQDETKSKTKHQRKQVLTPVETPELELIEPEDLGFAVSPKRKRKTEESKIDKSPKALVPKKSYLLGRDTTEDDKVANTAILSKNYKEPANLEEPPKHNAASAIDSLVKAAALIETQSENVLKKVVDTPSSDSQATPVKRGRGRPRKYPLPEGDANKNKAPSPQKKPRLIDAKVKKPDIISDDDDESSGDEMIKENWTMGKINENIVCPICSKLFRSENVVFKHVKHCTGPSPSRSDSDKRSSRRGRYSQESESTDSKMTDEMDSEISTEKSAPKKRKSKESSTKSVEEKDDIIVIEDTPIKERLEKRDIKANDSKKVVKNKIQDKVNNLVCEICGKSFRQLSYLVSHKLQHGKEEQKKIEPTQAQSKSVFSCDICKKEFRKLHHLVQHRIIHNPNAMPSRLSRKSSSEQKDNKVEKDQVSKPSDDPSAGFRCEPCDKSFRKLHHLVEHRETHDGINRQKNAPTSSVNEKLPPPPQCEICKKTFRKLHHLIEHKEQHLETSSEKSDDKSVKSSLSTKDIIHECSLCYMVFPNEHSLTKHTVICQRKKKQSAAKALKQADDSSNAGKEGKDESTSEASKNDDDIEEVEEIAAEKCDVTVSPAEPERKSTETKINNSAERKSQIAPEKVEPQPVVDKAIEKEIVTKEPAPKLKEIKQKETESASKTVVNPEIPTKVQKTEEKVTEKTPKKKTPAKEKSATVVKRQKSINAPLPIVDEVKPVESSDDDEVRYMLNPDFKVEETTEAKIFMKVKAKKRNSLQIERPNSKDLIKRRISLQHPPKIPRLKPKSVEAKVVPTNTVAPVKIVPKSDLDPVPSTDSDDSDVKYSFPKTTLVKNKSSQETVKGEKKTPRKSLAEKRKSLSGIAKRKSMGKVITAKHKVKPSPLKPIKRRTADIEHRCDCGQLFSSAALLSRHTTLAHTPPRIRRKRSPPPDIDTKTITKPATKKTTEKSKPNADLRKSSTRSDTSNKDKSITKSVKKTEESAKKVASSTKTRRSAAHRGVPVPEKMRKLMEKCK